MAYGTFIQRQVQSAMEPLLVSEGMFTLPEVAGSEISELEAALGAVLGRKVETMLVTVDEAREEFRITGTHPSQRGLAEELDHLYGWSLRLQLGTDGMATLDRAFGADVPADALATWYDAFTPARRSAARILYYYAGWVMARADDKAAPFRRLVNALRHATIPVAHLPGRPNLWTVLVRNAPGNPRVIAW